MKSADKRTGYFYFCSVMFLLLLLAACSKDNSSTEPPVPDNPLPEANLVSVSVKTLPAKTSYFIGETFSPSGLTIEGRFDNGESRPLDLKLFTITGFSSEEAIRELPVKVAMGTLTATFTVEIYPFEASNGQLTAYTEDYATVTIPEGITSIAADVFIARIMDSVSFPATLREVGDYAFFSCKKLQRITLPRSVTKLGEGVFDNCTALTGADLSQSSITMVSDYLFNRCDNLTDVKLPEGITAIGNLAFNNNYKLKNLTIPSSLRMIGLDAFRESGLESISLPNNVEMIRQRAFQNCRSLKEVTTNGIYTPSDGTIPPVIESSAFQNVPAITRFEIPLGVTRVEQVIISDSPLLTSITIPASMRQITFYAFITRTGINHVRVISEIPAQAIKSNNTWDPFPANVIIEVPSAALNTYKQADGWNQYAANMVGY